MPTWMGFQGFFLLERMSSFLLFGQFSNWSLIANQILFGFVPLIFEQHRSVRQMAAAAAATTAAAAAALAQGKEDKSGRAKNGFQK